MPRVLILCEFPTLLGGERSMLATLPHLEANGFTPLVAAPKTGPLGAALDAAEVEHVTWNVRYDSGARRPIVEIRAALAKIIARVQPNLVHANSLSTSRISGPVIENGITSSIGHLRDIVRLSRAAVNELNHHARIVAVSRATGDWHVAQGLDRRRTIVLHNGVDLERFHPREKTGALHRELKLPRDARIIATIGQIGMRKGLDVAMEAMRLVNTNHNTAHLLVVGGRTSQKQEAIEFERNLQQAAAVEPLAGHVHFLGCRGDVPGILCESAILLHAARQEPLGRVLLEAAASGTPIVATDVGGTREIFPDASGAALLVPPEESTNPGGSAPALARRIVRVLNDGDLAARLGANARRRAAACFSAGDAARKLMRVYQSVL